MGTKSSNSRGRDLAPLPWRQEPVTPLPEVRELYGDEADALWAAAWLNQHLDEHERAFAGTAPAPLL